jgi:hypothetical protein
MDMRRHGASGVRAGVVEEAGSSMNAAFQGGRRCYRRVEELVVGGPGMKQEAG